MRSVSRRTTGTSPFQPRSPPVYSYRTRAGPQAQSLDRQVGDLPDRDVIAGRDVEDLVGALGARVRQEHGRHHVLDMDVGLRLGAVAQDDEPAGIATKSVEEVEADPVGLAGPDHVAEAERATDDPEHVGVRADDRLAGELAGPVGGDRQQRSAVLLALDVSPTSP